MLEYLVVGVHMCPCGDSRPRLSAGRSPTAELPLCFERARLQAAPQSRNFNTGFSRRGWRSASALQFAFKHSARLLTCHFVREGHDFQSCR